MNEWIGALAEHAAAGRAVVLVTLLRAAGSTPREPGAKMVVWLDGQAGTIGGGHLELRAVTVARELLANPRSGPERSAPVVQELALGASLGQCCGGSTTLLFEPVLPPAWTVAVFGAGHVGKALVALLADLPCQVRWIDGREAEFPAALPRSVERVLEDVPADAVADLPPATDVVVMTHDHRLDLPVVEAALRRGDLGYVGLIGSATKRAKFLARMAERGLGPEILARLTCPIGLPGIRGKLPAEIAISVAAQLLQNAGRSTSADAAAPAGSDRTRTLG